MAGGSHKQRQRKVSGPRRRKVEAKIEPMEIDAQLTIHVLEVVNAPLPKGRSRRAARYVSLAFEKQEVTTTRFARASRLDVQEKFVFDVTTNNANLVIAVCDESVEGRKRETTVIGSISIRLQSLIDRQQASDHWYALNPPRREPGAPGATGDGKRKEHKNCGAVHVKVDFTTTKGDCTVEDFQMLKMLGKGSFGKVVQVKKRDTGRIYAMKVLRKQDLLARHEVEHTTSERNVLRYCQHPFVVGLKYAFQTDDKLYLIMDYVAGGELFFHLKKDIRFSESRARLYCAEIVLALDHLHRHGIAYRDLKPENVLLDMSGHVCLTDFGLCKEDMSFGTTTDTFCGTSEYLAPEVLRRSGHDKAVDWWSLGTLLFEMLVGIPPFYSENTREMFENILYRKIEFPSYVTPQARALVTALLQRAPGERLGGLASDAEEVKSHPFFAEIDWDALLAKKLVPSFIPQLSGPTDVSYFDEEFTNEDPLSESPHSLDELTIEQQEHFRGFSYVAWAETLTAVAEKHGLRGDDRPVHSDAEAKPVRPSYCAKPPGLGDSGRHVSFVGTVEEEEEELSDDEDEGLSDRSFDSDDSGYEEQVEDEGSLLPSERDTDPVPTRKKKGKKHAVVRSKSSYVVAKDGDKEGGADRAGSAGHRVLNSSDDEGEESQHRVLAIVEVSESKPRQFGPAPVVSVFHTDMDEPVHVMEPLNSPRSSTSASSVGAGSVTPPLSPSERDAADVEGLLKRPVPDRTSTHLLNPLANFDFEKGTVRRTSRSQYVSKSGDSSPLLSPRSDPSSKGIASGGDDGDPSSKVRPTPRGTV